MKWFLVILPLISPRINVNNTKVCSIVGVIVKHLMSALHHSRTWQGMSNRSWPSVYTCTGNGIVWKYLPHLASSWEKVKVRLYWSQGHKPNDGVFFVCACIKQWKKGCGQLLLCTVLFCGVSVVSFTFSYLHHVQWTLNSCCYKQYILLWKKISKQNKKNSFLTLCNALIRKSPCRNSEW